MVNFNGLSFLTDENFSRRKFPNLWYVHRTAICGRECVGQTFVPFSLCNLLIYDIIGLSSTDKSYIVGVLHLAPLAPPPPHTHMCIMLCATYINGRLSLLVSGEEVYTLAVAVFNSRNNSDGKSIAVVTHTVAKLANGYKLFHHGY